MKSIKKIYLTAMVMIAGVAGVAQTVDQRVAQIEDASNLIKNAILDAKGVTQSLNLQLRTTGTATSSEACAFRQAIAVAMETVEEQQDEIQFYAVSISRIDPDFDPTPITSRAAMIEGLEDGVQNSAEAIKNAIISGDYATAVNLLESIRGIYDQQLTLVDEIKFLASKIK